MCPLSLALGSVSYLPGTAQLNIFNSISCDLFLNERYFEYSIITWDE